MIYERVPLSPGALKFFQSSALFVDTWQVRAGKTTCELGEVCGHALPEKVRRIVRIAETNFYSCHQS